MTEQISNERQSNAELVDQLRRLVDEQEGGDAVVLVQRQLFNRVVGQLAETLRSVNGIEPVGDWVVVPREPTEAMIDAGREVQRGANAPQRRAIWRAMIAAAPASPLPLLDAPEPVAWQTDRAMRDGMVCAWPDCGCDFDAKCSDAPAPSPLLDAPRVKALDWVQERPGSAHMWASSPVGKYTINVYAGMRNAFQLNRDHGPASYFDTEQEAKAAAQADFDARILSALQSGDAPKVTDDPARDVLAERRRQVEAEGWTPEHDDQHVHGELAEAAAGYAEKASGRNGNPEYAPRNWPWDLKWWKPAEPRRMLIKAAALILAEIERLDRLSALQSDGEGK